MGGGTHPESIVAETEFLTVPERLELPRRRPALPGGKCRAWLKELSQTSEQVPEEKLHVLVFKCLQKDTFLCAVPCADFGGGSEKGCSPVWFCTQVQKCKKKKQFKLLFGENTATRDQRA